METLVVPTPSARTFKNRELEQELVKTVFNWYTQLARQFPSLSSSLPTIYNG